MFLWCWLGGHEEKGGWQSHQGECATRWVAPYLWVRDQLHLARLAWPFKWLVLYHTSKIFLKAYHPLSTTPNHARHDQMKCLLRLFTFLLGIAQFSHPGLVCCFLFLTLEYFWLVLLRFAHPSAWSLIYRHMCQMYHLRTHLTIYVYFETKYSWLSFLTRPETRSPLFHSDFCTAYPWTCFKACHSLTLSLSRGHF